VVIVAVAELVDVDSLVTLYRLYTGRPGEIYGIAARPDFLASSAALLGVLVFDTLPGLFIGIRVSLLLLLYRASRPHVAVLGKVPGTDDQWADRERHPANLAPPGVAVLRVESALFFANADVVRREVRAKAAEPGVRAVVIDAETVGAVDVTAVRMLAQLGHDLAGVGVRLALAHGIGQVRDMLRTGEGPGAALELYPTVDAAVAGVT
jgi:MFS superfamily sulfate permease-like transporter